MPAGPAFDTPPTMFSDPVQPHLGGYIKGGDPWSYYPELWDWLLESNRLIYSVLDIGCGEGHALRWFRDRGCHVRGVEGVPQDDPDIIQHDYTKGPYQPEQRFDVGWCCEFVEHVEERFLGNFLVTFMACDLLLMTHAIPGQGGHHHVNCQDSDYWIRLIEATGFFYNADLTRETRALAGDGYYAWTGLAFHRLL